MNIYIIYIYIYICIYHILPKWYDPPSANFQAPIQLQLASPHCAPLALKLRRVAVRTQRPVRGTGTVVRARGGARKWVLKPLHTFGDFWRFFEFLETFGDFTFFSRLLETFGIWGNFFNSLKMFPRGGVRDGERLCARTAARAGRPARKVPGGRSAWHGGPSRWTEAWPL